MLLEFEHEMFFIGMNIQILIHERNHVQLQSYTIKLSKNRDVSSVHFSTKLARSKMSYSEQHYFVMNPKVIPIKVMSGSQEYNQIPPSPIMANSEFPNMVRLGKFGSDTFLEDSLRLCSPIPDITVIFRQIISYIKYMINLLEEEEPMIEESMVNLKLSTLYPYSNPTNLVDKAIEEKLISRKFGLKGKKFITVV